MGISQVLTMENTGSATERNFFVEADGRFWKQPIMSSTVRERVAVLDTILQDRVPGRYGS